MDLLVVCLCAAALAGSAALTASSLRLGSLTRLILASYVIAFAAVVALSLFVSALDSSTTGALVTSVVALLPAALGIWLLAGAPRPPSPPLGSMRSVGSSRLVTGLTIVAAAAIAYVVVLILTTPPNGWDQLNYHLARAALWLEQGGAGYVDHAYDPRISSYPPNAELAVSFVLGLGRHETLAALVQLSAALACAVGVWALARHFGLRPNEAAFGALLFLLLPIVLLQASTPKNDLVVASFLVAATVFTLGESRSELALAGLAVALAVGTKFTAGYGVLLLLAAAVLAAPESRRLVRVGAILAGTLAGSYWYALNLMQTGSILGDTSGIPGLTAPLRPRENVVEALGLTVDAIDLSGAEGLDLLLYPVVAALLVSALLLIPRASPRCALLAGALVCSPLLLHAITTELGRPLLLEVHGALGEPQAYIPPDDDPISSPTFASDTGSWYGPVGLLLVLGTAATSVALVHRGRLPRVAAVAGIAPVAWWALLSLSLTYNPWQGRFFLFAVALSAGLWGLALRVPALAWSVGALATTTALLSLVHYSEKPSGFRLLEPESARSVWSMARSEVQSLHDPPLEPVFAFLDESVPADASIALALGVNDFGFPAFGPRLERRVVLVPFGSAAAEIETGWLYASAGRAGEIDQNCWEPAFSSERGAIFRRQPEACDA